MINLGLEVVLVAVILISFIVMVIMMQLEERHLIKMEMINLYIKKQYKFNSEEGKKNQDKINSYIK